MRLLVRTWNLFHGRTVPETRRSRIREALALVCEGSPDVVCLQEVPRWALRSLERWSGLAARWVVTKHALAGPAGRLAQLADARLARSPVTGQANAVLISPRLAVAAAGSRLLNPGSPRERRACQLLGLRAGGRELLVANAHLSTERAAAEEELVLVAGLVGAGRPAIVCGDLNVEAAGLPGFSPPMAGIDQILVRGPELVRGPAAWPDARRSLPSGERLSDHAPVEAEIMLP